MAMRASSPPVAAAPSLSRATALTAPSWKCSTSSAALRSSDQRMAEVSKLPDIRILPSGDTARARTGPPCPRNCALAVPIAGSQLATSAQQHSEAYLISRVVLTPARNSTMLRRHGEFGWLPGGTAWCELHEQPPARRPRKGSASRFSKTARHGYLKSQMADTEIPKMSNQASAKFGTRLSLAGPDLPGRCCSDQNASYR